MVFNPVSLVESLLYIPNSIAVCSLYHVFLTQPKKKILRVQFHTILQQVLTLARILLLLNFLLEPCLRPFHLGRVEANQPSSKTTPAKKEPIDINYGEDGSTK